MQRPGDAPSDARGRGPGAWTAAALPILLVLSACGPPLGPGARLYKRHCASCHGVDGGGGVRYLSDEGANLTDNSWTYGGDAASLEGTLREGLVFEHPLWELSDTEIRQLVDHLLELRGESR